MEAHASSPQTSGQRSGMYRVVPNRRTGDEPARPPWPSTPLTERTVLAAFSRSVARHPEKTAIEDGASSATYAQLYEQARRASGGLAGLGVAPQDPVLLMLDNHVDCVTVWLGLCFLLGVEVPLNTAYRGRPLAHIINDCAAKVMVVEEHYCDRLAVIADDVPALRTVVVRGGSGAALRGSRFTVISLDEVLDAAPREPLPAKPGDLIGYLYTSGTTGPPRGAMIPYGHAWSCGAPEFFGSAKPSDRILITLPFFHVVGQWAGVLNAFISGATAVLRPRFHASTFWDEARQFGCTYTLMLGTMASFLYRQPARPNDADNPIERAMMFPVVPEIAEFQSRFDVEVFTSYGMTEVSSPLVGPAGTAVPGGCGWVRPDFEARLVDENDLEVERGSVGELLLRPKLPWSVMRGYRGDPQRTADLWRNLWVHTGDLMYQAEDGQFFFMDRRKDAIRRRGENISSYELESAINAHPAVLESAVVAVPSESTEDDVLAAVVVRPGLRVTEPELLSYLAAHLPYFMVPRYFRFLDGLPKTPTEKIMKHEIKAQGTDGAWDREAAGLSVGRDGLRVVRPPEPRSGSDNRA